MIEFTHQIEQYIALRNAIEAAKRVPEPDLESLMIAGKQIAVINFVNSIAQEILANFRVGDIDFNADGFIPKNSLNYGAAKKALVDILRDSDDNLDDDLVYNGKLLAAPVQLVAIKRIEEERSKLFQQAEVPEIKANEELLCELSIPLKEDTLEDVLDFSIPEDNLTESKYDPMNPLVWNGHQFKVADKENTSDEEKFTPLITEYKKITFRSRLESRWAVFYDQIGMPFEYEIGYFDVGNTNLCLPDFYLPTLDCFIQIKASAKESKTIENQSIQLSNTVDKPVYLFYGELPLKTRSQNSESATRFYKGEKVTKHRWTECPKCKKIGITHIGSIVDLDCGCNNIESFTQNFTSKRIRDALYQACVWKPNSTEQ